MSNARTHVAVAPTVTPVQGPVLQRQCACGNHAPGGECEACKQKRESQGGLVQRLQASSPPAGESGDVPPIVHEVLRSPGQPLDAETRAFMEPRFGHDFSGVRVHTDGRAAESARAVNALAYTVGHNVVFGVGQYAPQTSHGRRLIAHELTHVAQQRDLNAASLTNLSVGDPSTANEREAEGIANELMCQHDLPSLGDMPIVQSATQPVLMRSELFTSTIEICHRLLNSRVFSVSQGGLAVSIDARWEGPDEGAASCETHRGRPYNVTLNQEGLIFDDEYGTCEFDPQGMSTRVWTGLPSDEYHLTIWTNNTNPNCCLVGDIEVREDATLTGESCTRLPDDALTILHDALDLAGLVPALGAIPDAINAGVYVIEGDWGNAGLSAAAMVPIFGEGVTVTKLGVRVTRTAVRRTGREAIALGLREARATGRVARSVRRIAGTRGLEHSFDRHAHEWFGIAQTAIGRERHLPQWQSLLERAAESTRIFNWRLANDEVIGHLAYFQGTIGDVTLNRGRQFAVFFYTSGPRAGEIASAFVPSADQLAQILRLVN